MDRDSKIIILSILCISFFCSSMIISYYLCKIYCLNRNLQYEEIETINNIHENRYKTSNV